MLKSKKGNNSAKKTPTEKMKNRGPLIFHTDATCT